MVELAMQGEEQRGLEIAVASTLLHDDVALVFGNGREGMPYLVHGGISACGHEPFLHTPFAVALGHDARVAHPRQVQFAGFKKLFHLFYTFLPSISSRYSRYSP